MANSAISKPDPAGDPGTKRPKELVEASGGVSRHE